MEGRVRGRERERAKAAIQAALHRVALALSEVRVVERRRQGEIVGMTVQNPDGLGRGRLAYQTASEIVGTVRQLDGTTVGSQQPDRPLVREASAALDRLWVEISRLEGLEVSDGKPTRRGQ